MPKPKARHLALALILGVLLLPHLPQAPAQTVSVVPGSVSKVCQLIGNFDKQLNMSTTGLTKTRYGVGGTDLGSSFEHQGVVVFLFGDTNGNGSAPYPVKNDSFANVTSSADPDNCLSLQFYSKSPGSFLPPIVPGISQGTDEVPAGGVDVAGTIYAYFTTNYTTTKLTESLVLARFNDTTEMFTPLYTLSDSKFVIISVVKVNDSDVHGLPDKSGQGLLIFGSAIASGDTYLAYQPQSSIENRSTIRYFAGLDSAGNPVWSMTEVDAVRLFHDSAIAIGKLSVQWNPFLNDWISLYGGATLRFAPSPWGPWSGPVTLFDPVVSGFGLFIHSPGHDNLSDATRENIPGRAYAPYIIDTFTKGSNGISTIYFTMSTWNPYTVVLMKATLQSMSSSSSSSISATSSTSSSTTMTSSTASRTTSSSSSTMSNTTSNSQTISYTTSTTASSTLTSSTTFATSSSPSVTSSSTPSITSSALGIWPISLVLGVVAVILGASAGAYFWVRGRVSKGRATQTRAKL